MIQFSHKAMCMCVEKFNADIMTYRLIFLYEYSTVCGMHICL